MRPSITTALAVLLLQGSAQAASTPARMTGVNLSGAEYNGDKTRFFHN